MKTIEKIRLTSLLLNLVLIPAVIVLLWLLLKKETFDCSSCEGRVIVRVDTIRPPDVLKPTKNIPPKKWVKAVAIKDMRNKERKLFGVNAVDSFGRQVGASTSPNGCDSVYTYADTLYKQDDYHIVINDTMVNNKLFGRSVWFANLKPEIRTTIDRYNKEKIRIYAGASFTVNARESGGWGIGPTALITIPKIGAASYYYDVKSNMHIGCFFILVRFKN